MVKGIYLVIKGLEKTFHKNLHNIKMICMTMGKYDIQMVSDLDIP